MAEKNQKKAVTKKTVAKKAAKKVAVKKAVSKKKVISTRAVTKKVAAKKAPLKSAATKKTTAKKAAVKKKVTAPEKTKNKRASKKTKDDEECFLTTACVRYYSLSDDAYELMTLRTFRDNYMLKSAEGKILVKQYYSIAPLIVSRIKKDKEHRSVYQYIYHCIQKACSEIEQQHYRIAQQTYMALVNHLSEKYKLSS
jgi:hypothetical protein